MRTMSSIKSEAAGKIIFGIDIGGTTVKCGTFSQDGRLLLKEEIPTRKDEGGSLILSDIKAYIENILLKEGIALEEVAGIGLGVPGAVTDDGTVNKCINLGWGVFNVAKTFSDMMGGVLVKVGNDANMAALGEYWMGGAKDYNSIVMVTIGTGVGGGVIVDGKALCGNNGAAAEIGHLPIVEDETEYCNCGKKGCLEQVASASGIVRVANRFMQSLEEPSSLRDVPYMSARIIFDEAKAGDGLAIKVTEYVCRYLGKGLACAAAMVDPECFVIGGGVSNAGDYLIRLIEKYYKEFVFHPSKDTKIVRAVLGNDAGMYGAARLVL